MKSVPLRFRQSCHWARGCPGWSCHLAPTSHNPSGGKRSWHDSSEESPVSRISAHRQLKWLSTDSASSEPSTSRMRPKYLNRISHKNDLYNVCLSFTAALPTFCKQTLTCEFLFSFYSPVCSCFFVHNPPKPSDDVTHRHFVGRLYVEDQVLDEGDLVQVRDDPKTCVTTWHTQRPTHLFVTIN